MSMRFNTIFKKNKNIVIGAIHLPPLLGYPKFPGFDSALKNALDDLRALEDGGVDGIIFENNYDIPHKIFVDAAIISTMTFLGEKLRKATRLPLGVSVLWNDYRTALSIAKILKLQFVRVPVFVDTVKTNYGIIEGEPQKVINFRKSIGAENVALFTDIHVKHAVVISKQSVTESAKLAIRHGADAIVLTGKWTGEAPDIKELKLVRGSIGDFPILIGSGLNKENVKFLFNYADGAIVSTSLKKGAKNPEQVNVKSYRQRVDPKKVGALVSKLK